MSTFEDEPSIPREPTNDELTSVAIDPYLFDDFEATYELLEHLETLLPPELLEVVKEAWSFGRRVAFLKGVVAQFKNPKLIDEINSVTRE